MSGMNNGTLLCPLSDMSFMPCRNMTFLLHDPKMCDMSILPYGTNLVAYATIVDATIFAQAAKVHDPAGWLAKNLSGFQKSAQWVWAQWPVTMVSYDLIDCKLPGCCNFIVRQFSATFSLIHETFSLFARFRPVQVAN
jgi:hypothetical protein